MSSITVHKVYEGPLYDEDKEVWYLTGLAEIDGELRGDETFTFDSLGDAYRFYWDFNRRVGPMTLGVTND